MDLMSCRPTFITTKAFWPFQAKLLSILATITGFELSFEFSSIDRA
jgi:hypothetical protein